jgi:hypothetical protein
MRGYICATLVTAVTFGCGEKQEKKQQPQPGVETASGSLSFADIRTIDAVKGSTKENAGVIRPDLMQIFCKHVYKLPSKSDFAPELDLLCANRSQPTDLFLTLDRAANSAGTQAIEISHLSDDLKTEATVATIYTLPIPPKWVRSGKIQEYMMQDRASNYLTLNGSVTEDLNATVGGDLQFARFKLAYATDIKTPDGKGFSNSRSTDFNAFQVFGGNPDIGIGEEHLLQSAEYEFFRTLTITIGTHSGGSALITIAHGKVVHNSYPDIARRVFNDTASAQGEQVKAGLSKELQQWVIP